LLSVGVACSPGKGAGGGVTDSGNGGGSAAGGTSSLGGGGTTIIGGTSGASGATAGIGATGTGGSGPECAGDLVMGMPVPVDVYIMLDISGSMLTQTGGGTTKWDAVKTAIGTFVNDPMSAGLGVAIQYFPLMKPGVPAMCATDESCTMAGGTCLMKYCALYAAGYVQCGSDTDCMNALVKDDGPCEGDPGAMKCRLSGATCAAATDCQVFAPNVGPCVALGRCAQDMTRVCEAGTLCSAGNTCMAVTSGSCVHETECDQTPYATPAAEFGALPGAGPGIVASMNAQMPRGETPSRPALRGAIQHASDWATSHPGHSVVVVLATDGLPTDCSNGNAIHPTSMAEVDEVVQVATEGLSTSPNISTFVVGVFAAADTTAPRTSIASRRRVERPGVHGGRLERGREHAVRRRSERDSHLAPRLRVPIPTPPPGQTLDYTTSTWC
jgi:hypothetical protein